MSRLLASSRRMALAFAAVALVASWTTGSARANIAYAYAEETITLTTIPTDVTVTGVKPLSQTSANLNGTFDQSGTVPALDARQSLVGPGPGENSFVKFATFANNPALAGDLPLTPAASFARGDVQLTGTTGRAVSEVYLNGAGQTGGGDGNNHITYTFTTNGTAGARVVGFTYANDLYAVVNNPADSANGSFSFSVLLKQGATTLDTTIALVGVTGPAPATTNDTLSAPPNSNEIVRTGTGTITTAALLANTTYTITFSLDANTNAATAVPEPATMALALTALPLVGFGLLRRRNRKVQG